MLIVTFPFPFSLLLMLMVDVGVKKSKKVLEEAGVMCYYRSNGNINVNINSVQMFIVILRGESEKVQTCSCLRKYLHLIVNKVSIACIQ